MIGRISHCHFSTYFRPAFWLVLYVYPLSFKSSQNLHLLFISRKHGFHSYLKEMFDCPAPVMSYLCLQYRVHMIPVGTEHTRQVVENVERDFPELSQFYTANHSVSEMIMYAWLIIGFKYSIYWWPVTGEYGKSQTKKSSCPIRGHDISYTNTIRNKRMKQNCFPTWN